MIEFLQQSPLMLLNVVCAVILIGLSAYGGHLICLFVIKVLTVLGMLLWEIYDTLADKLWRHR